MLYEIHMLKNYPPVNLNRDDTGSPKTCYFGGVQRGRISSQCLKRAWRMSEQFEKLGSAGVRTRSLPDLVAQELIERGADEEFIALARSKTTGIANKEGKEDSKGKTSQMVFYSPEDIIAVADKMEELFKEAGSLKKFKDIKPTEIAAAFKKDVKTRPVTLDIAMFGRMVTSDAFRDVEAALQVAHAVSTHAVNQESDYFTAVDDMLEDSEETGAGMIGDIDFNACCFYHYVAIDTDLLYANLENVPDREDLVKSLVPAMLKIMAFTDPSGKQNSFAGHVLPALLCVQVKNDKIPVNYMNAFAKPVDQRREQVIEGSVARLKAEIDKTDKAFGLTSECFWFSPDGFEAPEKACVCASLQELCAKM